MIAGEMAAHCRRTPPKTKSRAPRRSSNPSLLMGLETPSTRAEQIAGQMFSFGRVLPVDGTDRAARRRRCRAVRRFGARLMTTRRPAIAAVGPVTNWNRYDIFAAPLRRAAHARGRMTTGAMAFMRGLTFPGGQQPVIRGSGVYLRYPRMADYPAWARLRGESREFLAPWEPVWATRRTDARAPFAAASSAIRRKRGRFRLCLLRLPQGPTTR